MEKTAHFDHYQQVTPYPDAESRKLMARERNSMTIVNISDAVAAAAESPTSRPTASVDGTAEAIASRTPELVFALCGPIGSPLHGAADQLASALGEYGYLTEKVRLSDLIRLNQESSGVNVVTSSKIEEIQSLIKGGDELRRKFGLDVLAKMAIAKISADRTKRYGEFEDVANEAGTPQPMKIRGQRICHIVNSIKNRKELDLLRLIYGDALFAIGVFSPLEVRRRNLEVLRHLDATDIDRLIDTDSGEEFDHGQSVRDTFPRCDLFVRIDKPIVGPTEPEAMGQLVAKLRRFLGLLFRTAILSPTADESAMYAAASASANSACMSRQVGAAVTTESGELLSVGWNDVPQTGGGLYGKPSLLRIHSVDSHADFGDHRCYAQAGAACHNEKEKSAIAAKIVESLVLAKCMDQMDTRKAIASIMGDTRVKDLIEFSRAVHAEMHAILGASRNAGGKLVGGKLFVTTYPCHSCARHIVAAGISEVVYIEPYRKSLATRLHSDSLTESPDDRRKVRVLQFDGVAPRRFTDLFEAQDRKSEGVLRLPSRLDATPSTHVSLRALPRLEQAVVAEVQGKPLKLPDLVVEEKAHD